MTHSTISPEWIEQAEALHRTAVVIDTHVDTTQYLLDPAWRFDEEHEYGHVDLPRLRRSHVCGVFFAVYVAGEPGRTAWADEARRQLDALDNLVRRYSPDVVPARRAADVRSAHQRGRLAVLIGIEGGHLIEDSLDVLREYRRRGASYLTLTHGFHTSWADSAGVHEDLPPRHHGLTSWGREVVSELNAMGMMVDVSHVSDKTFQDVLEVSRAPIIASHSSCRTVCAHRRNLSDDMIRAVAAGGGIVQINFASYFLDPHHPPPTAEALQTLSLAERTRLGAPGGYVTPLSVLVDHFEHALQLVGPRHVGIGSDYDGVPFVPEGVEDCSRLTRLTAALLQRGHAEADLRLMLGENVLRVMDACTRVAEQALTDRPMEL